MFLFCVMANSILLSLYFIYWNSFHCFRNILTFIWFWILNSVYGLYFVSGNHWFTGFFCHQMSVSADSSCCPTKPSRLIGKTSILYGRKMQVFFQCSRFFPLFPFVCYNSTFFSNALNIWEPEARENVFWEIWSFNLNTSRSLSPSAWII